MASNQLITLITGGNSGIGKALAGLLIEDARRHVIITSRSSDKGSAAVKELESLNLPGSVETMPLQITEPESIAALAKEVDKKYGRLDAVVNNAAVGQFPEGTPLYDRMQKSFETNVTGPAIVLEEFYPLLKKSVTTPRVINVSSGGGSIGIVSKMDKWPFGPVNVPYFTSKAALDMLSATFMLQRKMESDATVRVFTYCPGFTESNLGNHNKAEFGAKPTVEGARPMVPILNGEKDADHGEFLNSEGGKHPW